MKRSMSLIATLAATLVLVMPSIQATAAPPDANITDPMDDANFVNDQGTSDGTLGDVTGPQAGTVSDLLAVWFTNDAKNLYVHFETQAAPPAASGVGYRARVNPTGAPGTQCLLFEAFFPGANNTVTAYKAHLIDTCEGSAPVELTIIGTVITVPRNLHDAFGKGATLTAPQAQTFLFSGNYPDGVKGPTIDTTKVGTDFKFVDKKKGK